MNKNKMLILVLIIILLTPISSLSKRDSKKIIIFSVDSISMENIDELKIENYGLGLFNSKSRKPYDDKNFYTSINVGRKVSQEILAEELKLEFLGDVLKQEKPMYMGSENSNIDLLISDKDGKANGLNNMEYNYEWLDTNITELLQESKIVAIDYEISYQQDRIEILKKLISGNGDNLIYIIPRTVHKSDQMLINQYLLPILKIDSDNGVLTSNSTKRQGLVALEDISFDIKENFKKENTSSIGEKIEVNKSLNNLKEIRNKYKESINLLYIASIYHGLLYLSQALILIYILTDRIKKIGISIFVFATNNIWISFLLPLFKIHSNLILYLIICFALNIIITKSMLKNKKLIDSSIIVTYILILIGMLFKPEFIYNSYLGFNNLIYGARFYGLNNGIAAVLLATSMFSIIKVDENINNKTIKNFIIGIIPIINLVVLSAKYGANTGSFISAIALLLLVYYNYYFADKMNYKTIIGFIIIGIIIFSINIYYDSISLSKSHAVQFFERIKVNGIKEIYYMGSFKLKELIKLTIMPPFSLVIICQIMILYKWFEKMNIGLKTMLIVSILGFCINDTGNILLIYMLSYLILSILVKRETFLN